MPRAWSFLVVLIVFAAGCANSDAPVVVRGTVTLDGQPLANADVDFSADDGNPPQRVQVRDGKYEGKVRPGKYAVSIKSYRPKNPPPVQMPGAPEDPNEQYLPVRYNFKTELTAEVKQGQPGQFDFPLKTN